MSSTSNGFSPDFLWIFSGLWFSLPLKFSREQYKIRFTKWNNPGISLRNIWTLWNSSSPLPRFHNAKVRWPFLEKYRKIADRKSEMLIFFHSSSCHITFCDNYHMFQGCRTCPISRAASSASTYLLNVLYVPDAARCISMIACTRGFMDAMLFLVAQIAVVLLVSVTFSLVLEWLKWVYRIFYRNFGCNKTNPLPLLSNN